MEILPNELLINIFEYLTTSDRLDVATVSRHWFQILQLPTFAKDNHIFLNECLINKKCPPFKTFCSHKNTHRASHLTLNKIKFDLNNLSDIKMFLKCIGKDMQHLRIELEFDIAKFPFLIKYFPNLKSLTLKDAMQLNIIDGPFPDTLETLLIPGLSHNFEFAFIHKIPQLKTIKREFVNYFMTSNHIPKGFIQTNDDLKSILNALDVHSVIKTDLNYLGRQEITAQHVTHLTCSISKREKLALIAKELPNLKSLSIDCRSPDDPCFFGHDIISFSNVDSLILNERDHDLERNVCEECFETFLDSFANLDKLTLHTAIAQKMVNQIFVKLEKLREIVLFSHNKENLYNFQTSSLPKLTNVRLWSNNNASIDDEILLTWPSMPNLRGLEINLPMENIQPASWVHFCQSCPSLVKFIHTCPKYCVNDAILVLITKLLPKLKHLNLTSAHKLTPISFVSLRSNCPALQTLHLGRNWIDMGTVNALFTNLQQLQQVTDAQSYFQRVHTRVDFYEASNWTKTGGKGKKKCQKNEGNEARGGESDSSSSNDDDGDEGKKVWGWIPKQGWGYWAKDKVKNLELEPEFDARY